LRPRLTYANVISTLCLLLLLGGGAAYAAGHLGKSSVGSRQLKKNAVTTSKIKNEAITGAKVKKGTLTGKQIAAATLGTVPTAQSALTADTARAVAPSEQWHEVGAPGEPAFQHGWKNHPPEGEAIESQSVAFYKDHEGVVHLRGSAISGSPGTAIFQLPAGYRPAIGTVAAFTTPCSCGASSFGNLEVIGTIPSLPVGDGAVGAPAGATSVFLDGVTFRAES
jgi:hypothetical protein